MVAGATHDLPIAFTVTPGNDSYSPDRLAETRQRDTVIEENPLDNIRVHGPITQRRSPRWKEMYGNRWNVERVFKSRKESRCLKDHSIRGLECIRLHTTMSALTYQVTALVNHKAGKQDLMRRMKRKIA